MVALRGIGDPNRGDAYTVSRFASGREFARYELHRETKPETLLSNIAFGLMFTTALFLMVFWTRHILAEAFITTWKLLNG